MNDDLLIQRYLDGSLSREDLAVLNQRLRDEADLRQHLRDIAEQVVAFGDMARQHRETNTLVCSPKRPDRSAWLTSLALAASIAVLAASAWMWIASRPAPVLTLLECSGSVSWSHGAPIQPGEKLFAGTLETVGDDSSALFQFEDGSLITLQGEAELSFADESQKVLTLSRGTLSAEVKPQPAGRPMLIRTPSAVAEVVGTAFDLSARSDDTLLNVSSGLVKLKRLADGREIDVGANRSAVASLQTNSKLDAGSTPGPLTSWSFDFTQQTPPRDWRGVARDGRMTAMPYIAKKHADGSVTTHYGISLRTAMLEQPARLIATEQSVIRYRLRFEQGAALSLMLITHRPDGSFGGNFELPLSASELHPDAAGWCEVSIPLSRFHPIDRRKHIRERHPTPVGNILTSVLLHSGQTDAKLAVTHFGLSQAP